MTHNGKRSRWSASPRYRSSGDTTNCKVVYGRCVCVCVCVGGGGGGGEPGYIMEVWGSTLHCRQPTACPYLGLT